VDRDTGAHYVGSVALPLYETAAAHKTVEAAARSAPSLSNRNAENESASADHRTDWHRDRRGVRRDLRTNVSQPRKNAFMSGVASEVSMYPKVPCSRTSVAAASSPVIGRAIE